MNKIKIIIRKIIFLLLLMLTTDILYAKVSVEGQIAGYLEQPVRLIKYTDYYTYTEIPVGIVNTDKNGNFKIQFSLNEISKITIKTNMVQASFYAEPDSSYIIKLGVPNKNSVSTYATEATVDVFFLNKKENSLNKQIIKFENLLDEFYSKNSIYFAQPRLLQTALLSFRKDLEKEFKYAQLYLKTYIDYSIAPIEEACFLNNTQQFNKYFNQRVIYNSPQYMSYFKMYFKQYLKRLSLKPQGVSIQKEINQTHSYSNSMSNILRADSLLKNDTLRELILLTGLREWYFEKGNNKKNIKLLINYIANNGLSKQNRVIGKNFISEINILNTGIPAPEIELNSSKYKKLADLKGNYIYLNFWNYQNTESLQELKYIQKLEQKYGHRVTFISIDCSNNPQKAAQYFTGNKFNWILVHDTNKSISKAYNILTVPYYILIDTDTDILQGRAPSPSNNLEVLIKGLIKSK